MAPRVIAIVMIVSQNRSTVYLCLHGKLRFAYGARQALVRDYGKALRLPLDGGVTNVVLLLY